MTTIKFIQWAVTISTHSNLLLSISKWMSNRHFKLNRSQTELLFPLLRSPNLFFLQTFVQTPNLGLRFDSHIHTPQLPNPVVGIIQIYPEPNHSLYHPNISRTPSHMTTSIIYIISHQDYCTTMAQCQTQPKESSENLCQIMSHLFKVIQWLPNTHPSLFHSCQILLESLRAFPPPTPPPPPRTTAICHDLPLSSHTFLPSSSLCSHVSSSVKASPSHCI